MNPSSFPPGGRNWRLPSCATSTSLKYRRILRNFFQKKPGNGGHQPIKERSHTIETVELWISSMEFKFWDPKSVHTGRIHQPETQTVLTCHECTERTVRRDKRPKRPIFLALSRELSNLAPQWGRRVRSEGGGDVLRWGYWGSGFINRSSGASFIRCELVWNTCEIWSGTSGVIPSSHVLSGHYAQKPWIHRLSILLIRHVWALELHIIHLLPTSVVSSL